MVVAGIVGLLFVGKWIFQDKVFSCWRLLTVEYFCRRNDLCCDGSSLRCSMDRRTLVICDWMKTGHFCRGLLSAACRAVLRLSIQCNVRAAGSERVVGFSKRLKGSKPTQLLQPLLSCQVGPYLTKVLPGIVWTAAILSLNEF